MSHIQPGVKAPDFTLLNQKGESVSLADYKSRQHVVLYFYPKDETPGCVKEACSFRDQYEVFRDAGAEVVGISADSVKSHQAFALNRRLPFQLLSDTDNSVRKAYGVSGTLLGLLPGRVTFVIDQYGIVRHAFSSQLQIQQHIQEALYVIQGLEQIRD